eukprot:176868-Pyramimonas_sp.AAC.1
MQSKPRRGNVKLVQLLHTRPFVLLHIDSLSVPSPDCAKCLAQVWKAAKLSPSIVSDGSNGCDHRSEVAGRCCR